MRNGDGPAGARSGSRSVLCPVQTLCEARVFRTAIVSTSDTDVPGEADGLPAASLPLHDIPTLEKLAPRRRSTHRPRILLLYGSLRERSYSRLPASSASRRVADAFRRGGEDLRPTGSAASRRGSRRSSQGAGAARAVAVVGRPSVVQPR